MPTTERSSRKLLVFLALFVACFAVRATYIKKRDIPAEQDRKHGARFGYEMSRAALAVSRTGEIRDVFDDDSGPSAHVSPAYPYLLGGVYRLVGPDWQRMRWAHCLLSAAFASLGIALLPTVATRTGLRPWVGVLAAIPMIANPFDIGLECGGEWEQPLSGLTLLLVLLDADARRRDGWRSTPGAIRSGLLTGWSALLSPPVALASLLMPLGEMVLNPSDRGRIARGLAIQLVILVAALAPWTVRNYRDLGGIVPVRSNLGLELYCGAHDSANGYQDTVALTRHPYSSDSERAEYKRLGELAYMKSKMSAALGWIGSNPVGFARLTALRVYVFWFKPVPAGFTVGSPTQNRIYTVATQFLTAMNLGAILGLAGLFARRHPARASFAAALLGPPMVYAGVLAIARYSYPIRGVAFLLAMDLLVGVVLLLKARSPWRTIDQPIAET